MQELGFRAFGPMEVGEGEKKPCNCLGSVETCSADILSIVELCFHTKKIKILQKTLHFLQYSLNQ